MNENTSIDHTKIGMRLSVMPGVRSLKIVTMKLIAPTVVEMPTNTTPSPQKSMLIPGEYCFDGQRHVREPTAVGRVADEEAREQEDPGEHEDPVAEGVEPRERHVTAAEHQRDAGSCRTRRAPAC